MTSPTGSKQFDYSYHLQLDQLLTSMRYLRNVFLIGTAFLQASEKCCWTRL